MNSLELCAQLLGFACLMQTIELLQLKETWRDDGLWSWQILREDESSFPVKLRTTLDFCLNEKNFEILLYLRGLFSFFLIIGSDAVFATLFVFLSTWLCSIRWRGTFNGGSDSMTAQIALAVFLASLFPGFHNLALTFIAVQITASYTAAGVAKFRNPEWRTGVALPKIFALPAYSNPPAWLRTLIAKPDMAKKLSLGLIGFECLFPISWLHPTLAMMFIYPAIAFNLVNYLAFGLNRFVFAWLAGYPALYWIAWKLDQ